MKKPSLNINIVIVLILFIFIFLIRIPILVPMGESDEVPFCVIGKCLAEGSIIYNEIAHFKGPIRYYTFALFHILSGGLDPVKLRICFVTMMFLSAVLLFYAVLHLFNERRLATAGAFYWGISDYLLSHNTIISYTYGMVGIFFFSLYHKRRKLPYLFLMGLFFGVAMLSNQRSYPFIIVPGLLFLFQHGLKKEFFIKSAITGAGYLLPFVVVISHLHYIDAFNDFIFQVIYKATAYSDKITLWNYLIAPFGKIISVIKYQLGFLFVFMLIMLYRIFKEKEIKKDNYLFLLIWMVVCFLATLLDGKYVKRYNLYFLIPAVVFSMQGFLLIYDKYKTKFYSTPLFKKLPIAVITVIILLMHNLFVFNYEISRRIETYKIYLQKRDEINEICNYLNKILDENKDTIYVYNVHRGYDCLVKYRPAVRFIYSKEQLFDTRAVKTPRYKLDQSWEYFYKDIEKNNPRIIIDNTGTYFDRNTDFGNTAQNNYKDKLIVYIEKLYSLDKTVGNTKFYKKIGTS